MTRLSTKRALAALAAAAPVLLFATAAAADEPAIDTGDMAWMMTSTVIVLMMTIPGVALFYAGMVRKKNVLATLMQSFATCALITIVWMVAGYSLAFSGDGKYVGDLGRMFLSGMMESWDKPWGEMTITEPVFMTFQMTFAIITAALITGSFADRMKFSALLVFLALWSLLVYSPVAHWVWGGGFMKDWGVLDFAGGTVVHINAGVAGLVGAIVLGKRRGYGTENMAPYNLSLSVIGASLLWVGWFGFNGGSATASDANAGLAIAVTQIATAAAALAWMFAEWAVKGKPSVLGIISGAVAGLVGITPAAGFVAPVGALVIGLAAGIASWWASTELKRMLKYDDSLDVWGVHGVAGIVGAILTGLFAVEAIGETAGGIGQMIIQIQGVVVTIVYTGVVSFMLLKLVDLLIGLRVSEEEEVEGLDTALHGERLG
ncbi:ammonium transporter [Elioraea sp. Yellowstone]|jgi:Amt family ammonium transporter|uniref:ammonium transporter n=1 Tax=Elioraea sp. Yellowstone TaxID=2592070 RepID=UPI00114E18A8|nr:ammonium transporter [Elioraea sp. Yellowstone]TQF78063.1 ammonium transporter [Elioraea sp. Yellowstone]